MPGRTDRPLARLYGSSRSRGLCSGRRRRQSEPSREGCALDHANAVAPELLINVDRLSAYPTTTLRNGNQLLRGVARSRSLDGSQLPLVFGELLLDPLLGGMALDDVFAVTAQEVVDGLNPD